MKIIYPKPCRKTRYKMGYQGYKSGYLIQLTEGFIETDNMYFVNGYKLAIKEIKKLNKGL